MRTNHLDRTLPSPINKSEFKVNLKGGGLMRALYLYFTLN